MCESEDAFCSVIKQQHNQSYIDETMNNLDKTKFLYVFHCQLCSQRVTNL